MGRFFDKSGAKELGEIIRQAREQRHWSQDALAYAANMSQGQISDIEIGYRDVSFCKARQILNALDLDFAITDLQK